jgi:hypothetical protein
MELWKIWLALGAVLLVMPFLPGCSDPPGNGYGEVSEGDSAGIRIVTHPPGRFSDTVAPEPLLTIGQEGVPEYEFFRIQQVGALASGNIVVANGGTHELRFFDPTGRHIRTVGGPGEGPAEFGFLSTFWILPGDTMAVVDPRRRRLAYFDSAGTLVRGQSFAQDLTTQPPDSERPCIFPGLMGLLSDGTRVTSGWGCMMFQGTEGRRPTVLPVYLVQSGRKELIREFSASWVWERADPEGAEGPYSLIPLSAGLTREVSGNRVFVSEGSEFEIDIFDGQGRHVGSFREDTLPPRVTAEDRERYIRERAGTRRPHPNDVPFPHRFGAYLSLMRAHEGDLWARRYSRPGDTLQHWVVFSPDGLEIRRIVLPDFRMESVRDGKLYGHRSDSLGIQTVVVLDGSHVGKSRGEGM